MTGRVLIAVGDEKLRQNLTAMLRAFHAEFFWAETGEALFTYLKSPQGMDLIIFDDAWPDLSVEVISRTARKEARKNDPSLLALIESADAVGALMALGAGADMVLKKPVDPVAFLSACRAGQRAALLGRQMKELLQERLGNPEEKSASKQENRFGQERKKEEEKAAHRPVLRAEDGRPWIAKVIDDGLKKVFSDLEIPPQDCLSVPLKESFQGDFIGWIGAFFPQEARWYDTLFRLPRPSAACLVRMVLPHEACDDAILMRAIIILLESVAADCRDKLVKSTERSMPVFSPPIVGPYFESAEIGEPLCSQIFRFPGFSMTYEVHEAPAVARIQPVESAAPGDVLNENIMASPTGRIPVAARGVILTEGRLKTIRPHLKRDTMVWLIQPSLFARRMASLFLS